VAEASPGVSQLRVLAVHDDGQVLLGDNDALVGDPQLAGVAQHHMRRGPVPAALDAINGRAVGQRVDRPVMPQVMRRQVGNADLLAQQAHAIVEAVAGDAPVPGLLLLAGIAEEKWATGALFAGQVEIERHAGVLFQPVRLPVFGFGAIDGHGAGVAIKAVNVQLDDFADPKCMLDEESHHERVFRFQDQVARAWLAVNACGFAFEALGLRGGDGCGHGFFGTLAGRLSLLAARGIDVAALLKGIVLDGLNELGVLLADGPGLARQGAVGADRREPQVDGADSVARLPQPGAITKDQRLADAGPGGRIVIELSDAARHTCARQVGREVQQVEALAGAGVGRVLVVVFGKEIRRLLAELVRQVAGLLHVIAIRNAALCGWSGCWNRRKGCVLGHAIRSLSAKESYTLLSSVGLYQAINGLSIRCALGCLWIPSITFQVCRPELRRGYD